MNERIKALYKEATGKSFANDFDARVLEAEKFAELIVQECADLCSDLDGGENMFSRGIRKHFGVEA
jgi:hypothetical protein